MQLIINKQPPFSSSHQLVYHHNVNMLETLRPPCCRLRVRRWADTNWYAANYK